MRKVKSQAAENAYYPVDACLVTIYRSKYYGERFNGKLCFDFDILREKQSDNAEERILYTTSWFVAWNGKIEKMEWVWHVERRRERERKSG